MSHTPKSKHILFWGDYLGFHGGIERHAYQIAQVLRQDGFTIDYVGATPDRGQDEFQQGFDDIYTPEQETFPDYRMVAIHKLPDLKTLRYLMDKFPGKLVLWGQDHDSYCPRHHYYLPFHRINCQRAFSPFPCLLCALASNPRNWNLKGLMEFSARLKLLRQIHIVILSDFMANNLRRNGFNPKLVKLLHPISSTIAPSPRQEAPDHEFRLLFIGQLIRGKGVDLLLQAMTHLPETVTLTVVGDGKDNAFLHRLAQQLNLQQRITFTGWNTSPEQFIASSDLTIFPSRWQEPFGFVGLESMAHGVPVVGYDVGGVSQWLKHEYNGLLVSPVEPQPLAKAIQRVMDDPKLRQQLTANALETARSEFNEAAFLKDFRELLDLFPTTP